MTQPLIPPPEAQPEAADELVATVQGDPMDGPPPAEAADRPPFDPPGGIFAGAPLSPLSPPSAPVIPLNGRFGKGHDPRRGKGPERGLGRSKLALELGIPATVEFEKYALRARSFLRIQRGRVAKLFGGGECGPGPSLLIKNAAMQTTAADWHNEHGVKAADAGHTAKAAEHFNAAARLQNMARTQLEAANAMAREEKLMRIDGKPFDPNQKSYLFATGEDKDE